MGPSSPMEKGTADPNFPAHVYCGQTVDHLSNWSSGQSNLTTSHVAAAHGRFGSMVFTRLRQRALPPNTCFLGPTRVQIPNIISVSSAVFAGLTTVIDRPTNRSTRSVTIGCIYVRTTTAMWPNNNNNDGIHMT